MIYNEDSPSTSGAEYLHFSAMLWKSSGSVGCATVHCPFGTILSGFNNWYTGKFSCSFFSSIANITQVCNYKAEGNVEGSFSANVGEPEGAPVLTATIS